MSNGSRTVMNSSEFKCLKGKHFLPWYYTRSYHNIGARVSITHYMRPYHSMLLYWLFVWPMSIIRNRLNYVAVLTQYVALVWLLFFLSLSLLHIHAHVHACTRAHTHTAICFGPHHHPSALKANAYSMISSALYICHFQQLVLCENGACQIKALYPVLPPPWGGSVPGSLKQAPTIGQGIDSFTEQQDNNITT